MIREDFLMRMIRRLAELIGRALGLARNGQHEEAELAIEDIYKTELGMTRDMVERLDPATVARTLGAEKSMIVASLLDAEAQLAELAADETRASLRRSRASAIRAAAGIPM